jgi:hypothetical protein
MAVWKTIKGPDGRPFFFGREANGEIRIGVTFSLDWFAIFSLLLLCSSQLGLGASGAAMAPATHRVSCRFVYRIFQQRCGKFSQLSCACSGLTGLHLPIAIELKILFLLG